MRRVRRDNRPSLPKLSSSTKAPSLFTSKKNDYQHNAKDEEKKSLARNVTPLNGGGSKEVSIQMADPFEPPLSMDINRRNSIDEINRHRQFFNLMVKLTIALCLVVGVTTIAYKRPSGTRNGDKEMRFGNDSGGDGNVVKEADKDISDVLKEKKDVAMIKKDLVSQMMSETMPEWDEENGETFDEIKRKKTDKTKSKKKKKAKILTEEQINDKDALKDKGGEESPTSLRKAKKPQSNKPQLSGGIEASFTVSEISDLPEPYENFADLSSVYNSKKDVPFFWDIHLGGGTVIEHALGKCLHFLQASEIGKQHQDKQKRDVATNTTLKDTLKIVDVFGEKYLNVDTTTPEGLDRARSLKMFSSSRKRPAVVYSPLLHEMGTILFRSGSSSSRRGRMFALFRHPVDRAVGMYYYLQNATWDHLHQPDLGNLTVAEYAASGSIDNNWMTRFLVDKRGGRLTTEDLNVAKEVLRRKCLVGLFERTEESLGRFERYFGWKVPPSPAAEDDGVNDADAEACVQRVLATGDKRHEHELVKEGSEAWEAIVKQNKYDMELFSFVKDLYVTQGEVFQKKGKI